MENISDELMIDIMRAATWIIPIIFSVIPHEVAHGWAAYLLGDDTAKDKGRLSLNPIKHVDLYGTIIFPLLLMLSNIGFVFGYAKPVPVNFNNLRSYRVGMIIVALAGPVTNFVLAGIFICLLYVIKPNTESFLSLFLYMSFFNTVLLNIVLGIFNLLPIPPLDGGKVVIGLLPESISYEYAKLDGRKGFFLIFGLMLLPNILGEKFNVIGRVIGFFIEKISSIPFIANIWL